MITDGKTDQQGPNVPLGAPPPAYVGPGQHSGYPPTPMPQPEVGMPQVGYVGQSPPLPGPQPSEAARAGEQYRAELLASCAAGRHDPKTRYGVCGIITAVICFPFGLIALCIDVEERCARCGVRL